MCTISWYISADGYRVFFNRDEQVTRPKAIPPQVLTENDISTIMPVDPQGGGTWCAVNEFGFTFALLNYYQGRLPKGRLISRGKLVRACAGFQRVEQAHRYIRALNLSKYAPFSLLCFSPAVENNDVTDKLSSKFQQDTSVTMMRWTGRELIESEQTCPLISSAVRYDEVYESRLSVYKTIFEGKAAESQTVEDYQELHASHLPGRSSHSICMHRDDAQTVSFSQIEVTRNDVQFFYSDGPPCEAAIGKSTSLKRVPPA
ncbi:MAG: NRDE family protein [Agarilytica sp.]